MKRLTAFMVRSSQCSAYFLISKPLKKVMFLKDSFELYFLHALSWNGLKTACSGSKSTDEGMCCIRSLSANSHVLHNISNSFSLPRFSFRDLSVFSSLTSRTLVSRALGLKNSLLGRLSPETSDWYVCPSARCLRLGVMSWTFILTFAKIGVLTFKTAISSSLAEHLTNMSCHSSGPRTWWPEDFTTTPISLIKEVKYLSWHAREKVKAGRISVSVDTKMLWQLKNLEGLVHLRYFLV